MVLLVLYHALLTALGLFAILFSPLTYLRNMLVLPAPLGMVASWLGTAGALFYFQLPFPLVLTLFLVGSTFANCVVERRNLLRVLGLPTVLGGVCLAGFAFAAAHFEQKPLLEYGKAFLDQMAQNLPARSVENFWAVIGKPIEVAVLFWVPFLLLWFLWTSLGLAAFLHWLPRNHPCSGEALRKIQLPRWFGVLWLLATVWVSLLPLGAVHSAEAFGVHRLLGGVVFVQGCAFLSRTMAQKRTPVGFRFLFYSLCATVGYYPTVLIGAFFSIFGKAQRRVRT